MKINWSQVSLGGMAILTSVISLPFIFLLAFIVQLGNLEGVLGAMVLLGGLCIAAIVFLLGVLATAAGWWEGFKDVIK